MVDSVSGGDAATLKAELVRLSSEGVEGIPLIRAVLRRPISQDELKKLDQVAYVRFASVYRSFEDVDEFRTVIDEIRR